VNKYQREAERQQKARIAEIKQMAEAYFAEVKVTPLVPADRRRDLAGVKVSDTAYQLHSFLCGRSEACEFSNEVLGREVSYWRPLAVEAIERAIEELRAAELLAVEEQAGKRILNPHTVRYMLAGL
jgi:hypothetical protein